MSVFGKPEVTREDLRAVVGLVRTVASTHKGNAGPTSTSSDRTCSRITGLDKIPPLVRGFVVRSGIGSYDCEVMIGNGKTVVCSALAPVLNPIYGASQACMPVPGSNVLVYVTSAGLSEQSVSTGIILGVIPDGPPHGTSYGGGVTKAPDTEFPEGGVAQFTESGPAAVASDKAYPAKGEYQCGRPHDLVPGEYAITNHAGAGLVIGAMSTSVKGSEMASVRCSALDDQVRVVSGHFRHISSAGSEEIVNDGGFISIESSVSLYQSERLGVKADSKDAFRWEPGSAMSFQEKRSGISPMKKGQTAKKRLYRYAGYLGDVVNVFVANPDPGTDIESMDSDSVDQGLLHQHVDSSGRLSVRSAGGILLERFDRIPVPKRKHYPWDPAGDKADETTPEKKDPFEIQDEEKNPMSVGVTLGDMSAWCDKMSYLRFRQFKKDFTVPEQSKLKCPEDEYDKYGKGKEKYSKYDSRHAYIGLMPNGGIVLRDAWGSEIVMADGRITLNAAANIEIRSGSSVVVLGGDDVVAKAYNSIDLSATNKDVRIKAENNLQAVSMKRGVLIQSKAEQDSAEWDKSGEDVESTGVVIKADSSSVAVIGNHAEIQGRSKVSLSSFEDKKPSGSVIIAGKQISAVAEGNAVITAKGASGIVISEQSAVVCAPSVLNIGGSSAAQASRDKMLIGIPVDFENLYSQVISICDSINKLYLNDVEWLSPFKPNVFSKIDFRYRTSKQYGTDGKGSASGLSGGVFTVYEPSWAAMKEAGREIMSGCSLGKWKEKTDAKGEYPWPGKDAMGAGYMAYKEQNILESGAEEAKSGTASIDTKDFSSYHIRKTD